MKVSLFSHYRKILIAFVLLVLLILIGIIGFIYIEEYSLLNSFYMTIITIATVGYGEVQPLSDNGKIFTAILIIVSFGTFAYAIGSITQFIIEGEFNQFIKNRKKVEEISNIKDHVIICGFGRNGHQASQILKQNNQRFVVVEKNIKIIENISHKFKHLVVNGDATDDEILLKAGVTRAKALIATLPDDADNLFIVLSARNMNLKLNIISRASKDNSDAKLKVAGANKVIMPDKVGGAHMGFLVLKPDTIELIEMISFQDNNNVYMEEISFSDLSPVLQNKSLKELKLQHKCGANIIAFKTSEGEYIINPDLNIKFIPHSKIFVLGTNDQIAKLKEILQYKI